MPRIRQYAERDARLDFQKAIEVARMDANIKNKKQLAEAVDIPYSSFWRMLQEPEKITLGQLRALLKTIPLPASAVLVFVGYDRKKVKLYEQFIEESDGIS